MLANLSLADLFERSQVFNRFCDQVLMLKAKEQPVASARPTAASPKIFSTVTEAVGVSPLGALIV